MQSLHKTTVSWIPAHPIYQAVSMRRYWQALHESRGSDDPFCIRSLIEPTDVFIPAGITGRGLRFWQRRWAYPTLIRRTFTGEIAHVLDHSWADMLPHVPPGILKVVTVHDLIPIRFTGELSPTQLQRFTRWVSHVKSADAVIADSSYTKDEVIELLDVPSEIIRVVPCGVEMPESGTDYPALIPQAPPGTLTVGSIGSAISRKNLNILPEAFARYISATSKQIRLIRVGDPLPEPLATQMRQCIGSDSLIELGRLSDNEVKSFYQSVDVVVVPSLYEGFGLPVLEALAHGTPVISSNTTSLPEVGGDEAIYFDPTSPEELALKLKQLATSGMPEDWKHRAVTRAARFSWRGSLEGIYSVYQEMLDHKRRQGL